MACPNVLKSCKNPIQYDANNLFRFYLKEYIFFCFVFMAILNSSVLNTIMRILYYAPKKISPVNCVEKILCFPPQHLNNYASLAPLGIAK